MPISQHRMIRIVDAAKPFIDFYYDTNKILNLCHAGTISHQAAITRLTERLSQVDTEGEDFIKDERSRFNITGRRNDVERERIAAKRAGVEFVPPMVESLASRRLRRELARRNELIMKPPKTINPVSAERVQASIGPDDSSLDFSGLPGDWNEDKETEYRKSMGKDKEPE